MITHPQRPLSCRLLLVSGLGLLLACLLVYAVPAGAQVVSHTVQGRVAATTGEALPGVNVVLKGTATGISTDVEGRYTLTATNPNDTLVFTFVGFQPLEEPIRGRTNLDVFLTEEVSVLNEVVVVGYGTQTRADVTGSVGKVRSEDIGALPLARVDQALQGRAAGVQVINTDAQPGGSVKVRIRGGTSINAGSDPLYVIDGFAGGDINSISPEDIASMEILKDASATAIYGARGANGVVIISTKKGKPGRTNIDVQMTPFSSQQVVNTIEVLNAQEFAEYMNEVALNDGQPLKYPDPAALGEGTNHLDAVLRDASLREYQISASGGTERVRFYVSGNYFDQTGVIINSDYNRYSIRSNLDFFVNENLQIRANLFGAHSMQNGTRTNTGGGALTVPVTASALRFNPTLPIRDADGRYTINNIGDPSDNAYALATELTQETMADNVLANLSGEYDLGMGLSLNVSGGLDLGFNRFGFYDPTTLYSGGAVRGQGRLQYTRRANFLSENYLSFRRMFANLHEVSAQAGYSYQTFDNEFTNTVGQGFGTDSYSYYNLGAGATLVPGGSGLTEWAMESYYGRLNYNFGERYLATFTARYDGSSRFAKNNKFGFFPSGALAWNVNNEPFMRGVKAVSILKLRASYGITGNTEIGSYNSLAALQNAFVTIGGVLQSSVVPTRIANDNLSWESTAQLDVGADIGLFQDRVFLTADYYVKNTSDLLLNVPLPQYSGFTQALQNVGRTRNRGWEFELRTQNLTGALKWSTDFNLSLNKNEVVELVRSSTDPNASNDIFVNGAPDHMLITNTGILREGEPVGVFYGWIFDGVDPETGAEILRDLDGNGTINNSDRTIIGNPNPDYLWGFNNTLSYKGLDLNVFWQATVGGDIMNFMRLELEDVRGFYNQSRDVLDRWTPENRNTNIPKASTRNTRRVTSRWVEDGSYVRLKNVSLGYNIPQTFATRLGVRSARLTLSGQNLLTFTDYKGWDPEVNSRGNSNTLLGIDYGSYPRARSYTLAIGLGL